MSYAFGLGIGLGCGVGAGLGVGAGVGGMGFGSVGPGFGIGLGFVGSVVASGMPGFCIRQTIAHEVPVSLASAESHVGGGGTAYNGYRKVSPSIVTRRITSGVRVRNTTNV